MDLRAVRERWRLNVNLMAENSRPECRIISEGKGDLWA